MLIASVPLVRQSEDFTMKNEPVSSIDLMERAGTQLADYLTTDFQLDAHSQVIIFCGQGNNGGDGLVVARKLALHGCRVIAVCVAENDKTTPDFNINLERYRQLLARCANAHLTDYSCFESSYKGDEKCLVVDALFGIGLSRPLSGFYARVVRFINEMNQIVVAVDTPSGLFLDGHTQQDVPVVHAHYTYTFQWQKWAYLLPENAARVGTVKVLDIGLQIPDNASFTGKLIDKELVRSFYVAPPMYAHKGSNGHGLLVAGSGNMPGAAVLAATAALRAGIGKVTVHTTANVARVLPAVLPEAIVDTDANGPCVSSCKWENMPSLQAIAIGPGIGTAAPTAALLKDLLSEVHSPVIFDADALNILAENKTLLAYLPAYSILTPHFKEFERLAGKTENDFERLEKLRDFVKKYQVVVVLKGHHSVVAMPDGKMFVNTTGNAGMATAGSGDVLTGVLLACMAKGYPAALAALLAVYVHGLAGDCALNSQSMESMIASDICQHLGCAFKQISGY